MNDGCQCAFANVVVRNIIVQCFVFFGYVILRLHRFSRVVHREPSVPSALFKGPTLYEDRDAVRLFEQRHHMLGMSVAGKSTEAS